MQFRICTSEQGSPQWHQDRLGRITASTFSQITTATGKLSASCETLINRAVAELITGIPDETFINDNMIRGQELEDEARHNIAFELEVEINQVGFVQSVDENGEDYFFGFSPDGENFKQGFGGEFKCPLAHTHLAYLASGALPKAYFQQVQGSMALAGVDKWLFGSYHPEFPIHTVWVDRDDKWCKAHIENLKQCHEMILEKYNKLKSLIEVAA